MASPQGNIGSGQAASLFVRLVLASIQVQALSSLSGHFRVVRAIAIRTISRPNQRGVVPRPSYWYLEHALCVGLLLKSAEPERDRPDRHAIGETTMERLQVAMLSREKRIRCYTNKLSA